MSKRAAPLTLLLLSLSAMTAQAQAPLAWKLRKGDQFTLSIVTATDGKVAIAGTQTRHKAKAALGLDVTVRETPRDGTVVLDFRITSFQAAGSQSAAAIARIGKAIKGENFSATFDRAMHLKKFEGIGELAKRFAEKESDPRALVVMEKTLALLFRNLLGEAFVAVPDKATARGETWEQTSEMDALGLGTLVTKKVFTDNGPASVDGKTVRKVSIKGTLKLMPPKADSEGALPFVVRELNLKKQDYKGTLYFDPEAGRPASIDTRIFNDMAMSLEVNQMRFNGTATQEQTFQIRFASKKKAEQNTAGQE